MPSSAGAELRFASTAVRHAAGRVEVHGDLTINGVTRPVRGEGTVTDPRGDGPLTVSLEALVDRREYGPAPVGAHELRIHVDLVLAEAGRG